jgi:putative ABC transport system permease protein
VAAGELLPPVVVAALGGPLLGVLLAQLTLCSLSLRLLTGQAADPDLVLPWGWLALVTAGLLAAVAVVCPSSRGYGGGG